MKNTKTCPKCGSNDIIRIDGYAGAYGSGNNIGNTAQSPPNGFARVLLAYFPSYCTAFA